ncbi:hypothetical protein LINPERHAP2_LOCUS29662 [Linum perenne]
MGLTHHRSRAIKEGGVRRISGSRCAGLANGGGTVFGKISNSVCGSEEEG